MSRTFQTAATFCLILAALGPSEFAWAKGRGKTEKPLSLSERVNHLLDRLSFGPRPEELEKISARGEAGIWKWIEDQMNPARLPDENLAEKLAKIPSLKMSITELQKNYLNVQDFAKQKGIDPKNLTEDQKKEFRKEIGEEHLPERIVDELTAQKLIRAIEGRKQLEEVLSDFWFNHFNVDINKGEDRYFVTAYEREAIRPHIFGKFRDMLLATAKHPAMLFYLDNFQSRANGLNENYGRELMELHTLGVDGGYTQDDVIQVARALTGWSIDEPRKNAEFKFKEKIHDRGEKKILGVNFPANGGIEEGEKVIDLLANHPSTAKFIATKLVRYFVADEPPEKLVSRVAQRFLKTHGDLKQTYMEIFKSPEFWSRKYFANKIKPPFRYLVSSVRALGGEVETKTELTRYLNQLGEPLYRCPPPTGYKDVAEAWVNPGALVTRLNFGIALAANRINGVFVQLPHIEKPPHDPTALVARIENKLLHARLSANSEKVVLKEFNLEGRVMADGEVRPLSLAKAVGLVIGSPEFQRR